MSWFIDHECAKIPEAIKGANRTVYRRKHCKVCADIWRNTGPEKRSVNFKEYRAKKEPYHSAQPLTN